MEKKKIIKKIIPVALTNKEILDNRFRRVEILEKIDKIKLTRQKEELDIEEKELKNEIIKKKENGFCSPIEKLLRATGACIIDNEKSVGTEPAFRSLWDEEALNLIRKQIIKKVKEL